MLYVVQDERRHDRAYQSTDAGFGPEPPPQPDFFYRSHSALPLKVWEDSKALLISRQALL